MKSWKWVIWLVFVGILASGVVWAARGRIVLLLESRVISQSVQVINGQPYVPIGDVAKAFGFTVMKRPGGYELRKPRRSKRLILNSSVRPVAGKWYYTADKISIGGQLYEGSGSTGGLSNDPSFATFDVKGWSRFTSYVGIDDNHPNNVAVRLAIELDGQPVQEVRLDKGYPPVFLNISLLGHQTMTIRRLEVFSTDGRSLLWFKGEHYSIAEPTLSK